MISSGSPWPALSRGRSLAQRFPALNWAASGIGDRHRRRDLRAVPLRPNWPEVLIAIALAPMVALFLDLPVGAIGSRFGEIPQGLPRPHLPNFSFDLFVEVLPAAFSFTLLGGVESLLSAKVAGRMTGRKHRSNMEMVAQGISVTAPSRTATNIRAGALSLVSGMMQAAYLLLFMRVAAPLAQYIPLAALAGILDVVCWSMAETEEFVRLAKDWRSAAVRSNIRFLKDSPSGSLLVASSQLCWPGWQVHKRRKILTGSEDRRLRPDPLI